MARTQKRLAWIPVAVAVVTITAMGAAGWYVLMMPKIQTAGADQIRAAAPKELMATDSLDSSAVRRGEQVSAELNAMKSDLPDLYKLQSANAKPSGDQVSSASAEAESWSAAPAQAFIAKDQGKLKTLQSTLHAGPIARPVPASLPLFPTMGAEAFSRELNWCSRVLAKHGDHQDAFKLLSLGVDLADRTYWSSSGDVMQNLLAVAQEGLILRAIDRIAQQDLFTSDECKALLAAVTPAPESDEILAKAVRGDFQKEALTAIIETADRAKQATSGEHESPAGTFDPIATVKLVGQIELTLMKNVRRPLSDYDPSGEQLAAQAASGLPPLISDDVTDGSDTPPPEPSWWDKMKTRYVLNSGRNTIGRQLAGGISLDRGAVKSSCKWRALREATRALLAAKIYAASHSGKYPATTADFVPVLGKWPTDPFNGKPMLYNAAKGIVYSVGANLMDDGGQIDGTDPPDLGVHFHP